MSREQRTISALQQLVQLENDHLEAQKLEGFKKVKAFENLGQRAFNLKQQQYFGAAISAGWKLVGKLALGVAGILLLPKLVVLTPAAMLGIGIGGLLLLKPVIGFLYKQNRRQVAAELNTPAQKTLRNVVDAIEQRLLIEQVVYQSTHGPGKSPTLAEAAAKALPAPGASNNFINSSLRQKIPQQKERVASRPFELKK